MSKKLNTYVKTSKLLDIRVKVGSGTIKFNLFQELSINTKKINDELKEQPTHFAYLSLAMIKLKRARDIEENLLKKIKDSIFIEYKSDTDPQTGRIYSNDLAESYITQDEEYQEQLEKFLEADNNYQIVKTCVDSFIQRKDLIQTLSANVRQEKNVI